MLRRLLQRRWPRRLLKLGVALLALLVAGVIAAYLVPLPSRLAQPSSTVVEFADGTPAQIFLSPDEKYRIAVGLGEVDPDYIAALLRFEDKRFPHHPGVDPIAIVRALALNIRHGRVVSGASTITMQLVRVLEPRPRTLGSKVIEALRAMQLEVRLSKEEILEAYLQFIPYGGNLEGLGAACYAYFGHSPADLSADEIATLLAVPQNPNRRYPSQDNAKRLKAARDEIAAFLAGADALPRGEGKAEISPAALLKQIEAMPAPERLRSLPRQAPHATRWLMTGRPGMTRIRTTLDRGIQALAEQLMRDALPAMRHRGIDNGSLVLIDHHTAEVRALVGNFDFWDEAHGGQIVGFDQPRSPGSALKPFIYALGIDKGLVLPEHLVPDIPVQFGSYAPDNYDGEFNGLVRLEQALSRSLNVPFVNLLNRIGIERFLGTLRAADVRSLRSEPGFYGLSAAIGGLELTPLELAGLYTAFAQDGRYRPVRLTSEDRLEKGTQLFTEGAAYLTRRALSRKDRPDFPHRRQMSGMPPQIHWKTGTSYGHRDAWAVGSGPRYTAAVWVGNFDNTPSVDLVGAGASGPLLFDALEAVADRSRPLAPEHPPPDLKQIEVCAYSGFAATPACPHTRKVLVLRRRVPVRPCPYHVAVDVERCTGLALNPGCRAGRDWETRSFLVWPATIRRWLGERHRWLPTPPALAKGCETVGERRPPRILSPQQGQIAVLIPGIDSKDQEIPLEAESHTPNARLSWFLDGRYLGSVEAHGRLWWIPEPGVHELLVMDHTGLSAEQRLEVRKRR